VYGVVERRDEEGKPTGIPDRAVGVAITTITMSGPPSNEINRAMTTAIYARKSTDQSGVSEESTRCELLACSL
jgi:hypothetical protein